MPPVTRLFPNARKRAAHGFTHEEIADVAAFAPERRATPLHDAPALAAALGLARLIIKDESSRWDLNAFKITGVAYALDRWRGTDGRRLDDRPRRLVCASAGNHGRAVARAARDRALECRVYLPADAAPARVEAIRAEGADVVQIRGSYEECLRLSADAAREPGVLLVSDASSFERDMSTARGDGGSIPDLIVRGYARVFAEAAAAWSSPPDVIVVQGGVGGLVAAAAGWTGARLPGAMVIAAEPEGAACLLASARAGRPVTLPETAATSMVCLRCAEPSASTWPFIDAGVDAFTTVTDAEAAEAVRTLATFGIATAPSGACGLAALTALAPELAGRSAMVVVTEGA